MEVRKLLSMQQELWDAIEDWRHKHRISTSSEAMRRLLKIGLLHSLKEDLEGIKERHRRPAA